MLCTVDGRVRRASLTPGHQLALIVAWPVSAVCYLFWSRGYRGLHWALLTLGSFLFTALFVGALAFIAYVLTRRF